MPGGTVPILSPSITNTATTTTTTTTPRAPPHLAKLHSVSSPLQPRHFGRRRERLPPGRVQNGSAKLTVGSPSTPELP